MSTQDDNEFEEYDRDGWHRINQAKAKAGVRVVMPEDWAAIDAMARSIDDAQAENERASRRATVFSDDPVALRIAGHLVSDHQTVRDALGKTTMWTQWCEEQDASMHVLTKIGHLTIPLQHMEHLAQIAADSLLGETDCEISVSRLCTDANGQQYLAVMRGEIVCLFRGCPMCLEHIHAGKGFNHPDYIGPNHDWYDDRKVESPDDPWAP